jgi:acetyltransferase-like isoleucine patch superfamily enzyme
MSLFYFILKSFKALLLRMYGSYSFYRKTGFHFGKNFSIGAYSQIFCQDPEAGSKIVFGDNVAINTGTVINADLGSEIYIGDNVLIGPQVVIRGSNHGSSKFDVPFNKQPSVPGKIVIENNVWIGSNVVILPNVTIGEGSIIGAGSVVTKDIPRFSVGVGVPTKVLKKRE